MTEPADAPIEYPSSWKPSGSPPFSDEPLDPTEAEIWLGSLSPAELQATLLRVRGGH